jgi:hypothetical protein
MAEATVASLDPPCGVLCCVRAANGSLRCGALPTNVVVLDVPSPSVDRITTEAESAASATSRTATSERMLRYWERRTTAGC